MGYEYSKPICAGMVEYIVVENQEVIQCQQQIFDQYCWLVITNLQLNVLFSQDHRTVAISCESFSSTDSIQHYRVRVNNYLL